MKYKNGQMTLMYVHVHSLVSNYIPRARDEAMMSYMYIAVTAGQEEYFYKLYKSDTSHINLYCINIKFLHII